MGFLSASFDCCRRRKRNRALRPVTVAAAVHGHRPPAPSRLSGESPGGEIAMRKLYFIRQVSGISPQKPPCTCESGGSRKRIYLCQSAMAAKKMRATHTDEPNQASAPSVLRGSNKTGTGTLLCQVCELFQSCPGASPGFVLTLRASFNPAGERTRVASCFPKC
jgi:hypothetical protein